MKIQKILISLTIQFSARYVIRTGLLESLREFSKPVLLLGWDDPQLADELLSAGYEVRFMPQARMDKTLSRLRRKIHYGHLARVRSVTTDIDTRRSALNLTHIDRVKVIVKKKLFTFLGGSHRIFEAWTQSERKLFPSHSNIYEFEELIQDTGADYLLSVTPYLLEEEFLLRAAATRGVKMITAILSFDNLTTRPRIPILFDKYLLWNEYNRQELLRIYPDIKSEDVKIVGSPQFDFYRDHSMVWEESVWRERLGLPAERPVILFGAGPESITPMEPHIASQLDQAIEQEELPNRPIILLRLHPVDTPTRWEALLKSAKNIVFDLPWQLGREVSGKTNVTQYDIEKLVSTLKHSCVHINTSSTMTLDGAFFDRPQIGPAYDDRPGKKYDRAMRELYLREHYLPIAQSGGLQIAYSYAQLCKFIIDAFQKPELYSQERKNMIRMICTYDDGKSTQRVANEIKEFLGEHKLHSV